MKTIKINKSQFRKFLISYHGLSLYDKFKGLNGIVDYIKQVGCIQYDPLNIVGRNADLVMQARIDNYSSSMLQSLIYENKKLIDAWDKMMSIYSVGDWPYFNRIRERKRLAVEKSLAYRNSLEAIKYVHHISEVIKRNGPTFPNEIDLGKAKKGTWGHRKISSAAMDYMFNIGTLGINDRKNVNRQYDLIENILPHEILSAKDPFESDREFYKWYVKRRIGSIGIYWNMSGGGWLGHFLSDKKLRTEIIRELLYENQITEVEVEESKEKFYIRNENIDELHDVDISKPYESVRFIAPLDNLMWDRKLVERVFDFKYVWEVYKPSSKRIYGYYVLPVLFGDSFVARVEPYNNKVGEPLEIKNWWWEDNVTVTPKMIDKIINALEKFASFLNTNVDTEKTKKLILKAK